MVDIGTVETETKDVKLRTEQLMWIIAGNVSVPAERAEDYVADHADLVRRAREAPGCLDVAITIDSVIPGRIYNYERWESWEAIEAWRAVANAPDTQIEISDVRVLAYEIARERDPF